MKSLLPTLLTTLLLLAGPAAVAQVPTGSGLHKAADGGANSEEPPGAPAVGPATPPPSDTQCAALPPLKQPPSFGPGEELTYDLDALGAKAGVMTMRALPVNRAGWMPLEVKVQTNTFFSKIRRVSGTAVSELNPRTLRPSHYTEDTHENDLARSVDVEFQDRTHTARIRYTVNGKSGEKSFRYVHDGLDNAGAIHLLRQLPFKKDLPVCVDVYGLRRIWRVFGKVVGKEHVSLPVGEFDTWHIQGLAVRTDDYHQRREMHVWITDDARRLPVVAMGAIDLGVVRATLTSVVRPHEKQRTSRGASEMTW